MMNRVIQYKGFIILAGLAVGIGSVLNFLPLDLPIAGTEYTDYVYLAIMGLAAFLYFRYHFDASSGPSYTRKVPSRSLSNPRYQDKLFQQTGGVPPRPRTVTPPEPPPVSRPSGEIFDKFSRED